MFSTFWRGIFFDREEASSEFGEQFKSPLTYHSVHPFLQVLGRLGKASVK